MTFQLSEWRPATARAWRALSLASGVVIALSASDHAAHAQLFNEFAIPTSNSVPQGITLGPDGALWFTETLGNNIGRISTTGVITEYQIPGGSSSPQGITTGPDGSLWFTMLGTNAIGSITTGGTFGPFYAVPTGNAGLQGIVTGPDGALWFAENNASQIGTITTSGMVTEFGMGITPGSGPFAITLGSDNNLWFTEQFGSAIGHHHRRRCEGVPDAHAQQPAAGDYRRAGRCIVVHRVQRRTGWTHHHRRRDDGNSAAGLWVLYHFRNHFGSQRVAVGRGTESV
jgi:streptogramin lyase